MYLNYPRTPFIKFSDESKINYESFSRRQCVYELLVLATQNCRFSYRKIQNDKKITGYTVLNTFRNNNVANNFKLFILCKWNNCRLKSIIAVANWRLKETWNLYIQSRSTKDETWRRGKCKMPWYLTNTLSREKRNVLWG